MTIPKVIFQTAKDSLPDKVIRKLQRYAPEWNYLFFSDTDIVEFLTKHLLEEFPTILNVFQKLKRGQHRADLFRYAFLYKFGGVFIDSDAMIQVPLNQIVRDYDFFSVYSINPGTIFQGFLGATPGHFIIRKCLEDVLAIDTIQLVFDYNLLCRNMYRFIHECRYQEKPLCKLYYEYDDPTNLRATTVDDGGHPILIHYYGSKTIPL